MFSPLLFPPFFSTAKVVTSHNLIAAATGPEGLGRFGNAIQRAGAFLGMRAR
jgi:hypothetical protein